MPIRSVTSLFSVTRDVQPALQALTRAGFRDGQSDVFTGEIGADRLDTEGRLHGVWVRFVRNLQDIFRGEAQLFQSGDETLTAGGERGGRLYGGARGGTAESLGDSEIPRRD
jgi:hypothetical protein